MIVALIGFFSHKADAQLPRNNLGYPLLIEAVDGRVGSGFFLEAGGDIFLVTAKHVLFSPESGMVYGDFVRITAQSTTVGEVHRPQLKLYLSLGKIHAAQNLHSHPDADVVVIRVGRMDISGEQPVTYFAGVSPISDGTFVVVAGGNTLLYHDVEVTADAYVMGYPKSIGVHTAAQLDYQTPLIRRGIVAGKNAETGAVILDCQVDGGNSGGPVVQKFWDAKGNATFQVIGLVSEFVPAAEEWVNQARGQVNVTISNSGYSVIVPMDPVWEVIGASQLSLTQSDRGTR